MSKVNYKHPQRSMKQKVAFYLEHKPQTRDDDKLLCCFYWRDELERQGKDTNKLNMQNFFVEYTFGNLADAQTITRFRRLLQKENPTFRGLKYQKKLEKQEEVKKDLGY